MKWLATISIILIYLVSIQAQEKEKNPSPDKPVKLLEEILYEECGSQVTESQTYNHRWGKVTKIIDGNTITVEVNKVDGIEINNSPLNVDLVGIDTNTNEEEAKKFLTENLLNETVTVIGNIRRDNFFAIVQGKEKTSGKIIEVNRYLLENGIVKFKPFSSGYLVPHRTPCVYQKVEEKARKEKLGLWAR